MNNLQERWCTVEETARMLGRSAPGVRLLIKRGVLPALKIGGRTYILREYLEKILAGETNAEYKK